MKQLFLWTLFTILSHIGISQRVKQSAVYNDFRIVPGLPNTNLGFARGYYQNFALFSFSGDYEASRVLFDNRHMMVMGQVRQKEARIIMLTEKGDSLWSLNLPGVCYKLGRLGKNALLVHGERAGMKNFKEWEIFASLIDPETGKIVQTITVFRQSTDYLSEPKFFFDPEGKWFYTGSRKTRTLPRKYNGMYNEFHDNTLAFTVTGYTTSLQPEPSVNIPLSHEDDSFIGAEMATNGDLMMAFFSKTGIISGEKRNSIDNFKKTDVLSYNLEVSKDPGIRPFFSISPNTPGKAHLHLLYYNAKSEHMTDFATFDYLEKKVLRSIEITGKKFDESLKASYQEVGGVELGKPRLFNTLVPVSAMLVSKQFIVLLREDIELRDIAPTATTWGDQYFISRNLIIEVYNKSNEIIKRWLVPKFYVPESLVGLQSSGYISDNRLIVFNNDSKGNRPVGVMSVFDLTTLSAVSRRVIKKETSKTWMVFEPGAIMRFDKAYLLPYAESQSGFAGINAHFNSILEQHTIE